MSHFPKLRLSLRKVYIVTQIVLVAGLAAEITARVDDWLRRGVPFLDSPNWDRDLFTNTPNGRQGKPNGAFKHWRLNEFGFRGGSMTPTPAPGTKRIVVLGASEAFGLYESPDHEFPAQLESQMRAHGGYEVVNAALTGMTLAATVRYFSSYVARFQGETVVIYSNPLFYLSFAHRPGIPASASQVSAKAAQADRRLSISDIIGSIRVLERLKDRVEVPEPIQEWRDRRALREATKGRSEDWFFTTVPTERVAWFVQDLASLREAVVASGATLVVVTHAIRLRAQGTEDDERWLLQGRLNVAPRAAGSVLRDFHASANTAVRQWAATQGVRTIDADEALSGRPEYFADLVHFNDRGAQVLAKLIGDALLADDEHRRVSYLLPLSSYMGHQDALQ